MTDQQTRRKGYGWTRTFHKVLGAEVSSMTRYMDRTVQLEPDPSDEGDLLRCVESPAKYTCESLDQLGDMSSQEEERTAVLFNGTFNYTYDIQDILERLKPKCARTTRVVAVCYNPYLKWLFRLLNKLGLSRAAKLKTFVTQTSLAQLAEVSGWEMVRCRPTCYVPFRCLGLGSLINKVMPLLPVFRWSALAAVVVLRPVMTSTRRPSLSIVIPARNEAGNIENAILETPQMEGVDTEIIFVEGNSTDDTWEKIQQVVAKGHPFFKLSCYQQSGKGKNDAVRLGFSRAANEVVTILDADLTMPPPMLKRFYDAYVEGRADFINGSRLFYPMEGEAMRFLNLLGNIFFAKSLSIVLGMRLSDSLCGTKLLARHDVLRFARWRGDFGDFDPFGDFELLFPAAVLGLGCVDIPIRYRARTYGSTNISRFRHGLVLLKMTLVGLFRIRMGRTR